MTDIMEKGTSDSGARTRLQVKLMERAYGFVESGMFEKNEWMKAMTTFIMGFRDKLDLSTEADAAGLAEQLWNFKYTIGSQTCTIADWAARKEFEFRQKPQETEIRNNIDRLFCSVDSYRKSEFFKDMLQFSARFKELAPYNAMLVKTQMPSARYVLSARNWKLKYDRWPKHNARPLVILQPFGPVAFVFEIADTEPIVQSMFSEYADDSQSILNKLANPYATTSCVKREDYDRLISSLPYYGISLGRFSVASSFGAQICKQPCKVKVEGVAAQGNYTISINDKADESTTFASICHELGHYFCRHLPAPQTGKKPWWEHRHLTWAQKEFEAEIVSYIVCERHGVGNKSWEYLSHVLGEKGTIPSGISIDTIFKAANEVDRMVSIPMLNTTNGHLFAYDKDFKSRFDKMHRRNPADRSSLFG